MGEFRRAITYLQWWALQVGGRRAASLTRARQPARSQVWRSVPTHFNPTGVTISSWQAVGFPPNALITIERNGATVGSATADSSGVFGASVTPSAGGDTGAIYTAVNSTGTIMAGQSVEDGPTRALETGTTLAVMWPDL